MEPSEGGNQIFIKQEIKEEIVDKEENICEYQEPICQIVIKEESKIFENASKISHNSKIRKSEHCGKDFNCDKCGKYFAHKGNLNKHIMTVHERKKNFKCYQCGKSFGANVTLKKHINIIHKSIEYQKCESCGMEFHNKNEYLIHDHSNRKTPSLSSEALKILEKSIESKCEKCGKYFSSKGNLQTHIKTVHERKM